MFSSGKILFSQRPCDWNKMGLDIDGTSTLGSQGSVVSLSEDGKTLATLSGPAAAHDISENHGLLKIYQWTGSAWAQKGGDIQNSLPAGSSTIGAMCMSRNGNYVAVSEYYVNPPQNIGLGWGRVKIYGWNGSSWAATGQPIVYDNEINLNSSSLSLNFAGNVIAIGTPEVDIPRSAGAYYILSGMVKIYALVGSSWVQRGQYISDSMSGARTGASVSLSDDGNTLAATSLSEKGSVKVHTWSGSSWTRKGSDMLGKKLGDAFGVGMCLSGDGNTVVAGAPSSEAITDNSYLSAYSWNGSSWTQKGSDMQSCFGGALSLGGKGNVVATGSLFKDNGRARVYEWTGSAWRIMGKEFKGTFTNTFGSRTGQSISISGDGRVVAVGNPGTSNTQYACGKVYAYEWSQEKPSVLFVRW
jgi:hypothetical protein